MVAIKKWLKDAAELGLIAAALISGALYGWFAVPGIVLVSLVLVLVETYRERASRNAAP